MKEIFIKTQKTARIFSKNSENKEATEVVIALHGYAQLASFFIQKFDFLSTTYFQFLESKSSLIDHLLPYLYF